MNRKLLTVLLFPLIFMAIGGTLNSTCEVANGGYMPVIGQHAGEYLGNHHIIMGSTTKLAVLGDRFIIGKWLYSYGDFILAAGTAMAGMITPAVVILNKEKQYGQRIND